MLILTRKRDEVVVIDGHILVRIVEIRGDKVRLGVEAPEEVTVNRAEVQAAIERSGQPCRLRRPKPKAEG